MVITKSRSQASWIAFSGLTALLGVVWVRAGELLEAGQVTLPETVLAPALHWLEARAMLLSGMLWQASICHV
jgi:hypothetical protein